MMMMMMMILHANFVVLFLPLESKLRCKKQKTATGSTGEEKKVTVP
jgi:hypothetical protein